MKKYLTHTFLFLIISGNAVAQEAKNTVKIGALYSSTPYLQSEKTGPLLQYDRIIKGPWGASVTVGGLFSPYDHAFGYVAPLQYNSGDFVKIIEHKELFLFSDLQGTFTFLNIERFSLKAGAGFSILTSILKTRITNSNGIKTEYNYPSYISIENDTLQQVQHGMHRPAVLMAGLSMEAEYRLTKRLTVGFKGVYRTAFRERKEITQTIEANSQFIRSKSVYSRGMEQNTSLSLTLGYLF